LDEDCDGGSGGRGFFGAEIKRRIRKEDYCGSSMWAWAIVLFCREIDFRD